jgi:hypothetical protein
MSRRSWVFLCIGVFVVVVAVALAWPPANPFAGAKTVALRVDPGSASAGVDVAAELEVVLNERNLRIVSDEKTADVVLAVTNARVDVANIQLALSGGKLTGRATAVCRVVNVKTGHAYTMDLVLTLRGGAIKASLVGRRFWEFWKPSATL